MERLTLKQKFVYFLKKISTQKITFLCIFHSTKAPIRKHFSLWFLLSGLIMWTFITGAAVYLSSRHIDYWSARIKSMILKSKYEYIVNQLSKNWELLAKVENNDEQIRKLLNMKTKKEIILKSENLGKGGPMLNQSLFLHKVALDPEKISIIEYNNQINLIRKEIESRIESYREIIDYISLKRDLYKYTPLIWPCTGRVTSGFGQRIHPVFGISDFHSGIDIADVSMTPIHATADGVVKFVGWQSGYGRVIFIEHSFGYKTVYGHLSSTKVNVGQKVSRGTVIGYMGDTGTTTGPHLHYEVWKDNSLQNPVKYLNPDNFFEN